MLLRYDKIRQNSQYDRPDADTSSQRTDIELTGGSDTSGDCPEVEAND
jgi:hypothetical protein